VQSCELELGFCRLRDMEIQPSPHGAIHGLLFCLWIPRPVFTVTPGYLRRTLAARTEKLARG